LHQEPREKLEVFPRLGYYFIVFRALDSELTRAKAQTQLDLTMKGDTAVLPFSDGTIGATNVYIVVFKEGICTVGSRLTGDIFHAHTTFSVSF
jgi:magnesium transporter